MEQEYSVEKVINEITVLKNLMYDVKKEVNSLCHPQLVHISQILDEKLNQYSYLMRVDRK